MTQDEEDRTLYKVVMNDEGMYSIWPGHKVLPVGWTEAYESGPKVECLAYIERMWTDMRPLSLRKKTAV